jgi:hypothetical protein
MALLAAVGAGWLSSAAWGASAGRVVRYHGYRIRVPAGWPVYDLSSDPTVCVRFNRHAVYLGPPSAAQRCPAHAAGRTEAILIQPETPRATKARADAGAAGSGAGAGVGTGAGTGAGGGASALPSIDPGAQPARGSLARLALPARGVIVTATWGASPQLVERALGRRSLRSDAARSASVAPNAATRSRSARGPGARTAAAVYTGLGFDACSAPSMSTMGAWSTSPYHAIGVYLGGTNSACAQPNLTAAWVSTESAAGWNLVPTYVGLQAPSNSCGCAALVPAKAATQGAAAADDAIAKAQALGIGPGSPIYFDMEAYPRDPRNTSSVLAFLAAWTTELHAGGYQSGVYSSAASGIADLAGQYGTGYVEPDDLWVADWNGRQSTSDPYVPAADWAAHQRLHQYSGSHTETYAGVSLDIDGDYLDGATAGATLSPTLTPTGAVSPRPDGSLDIHAGWPGQAGVTGWQLFAGDNPAALTPFGALTPGGTPTVITVHSEFAYFAVQALGPAGAPLGNSALLATPAHLAIYGRSVFVPQRGLTGIPVGCFTAGPCRITTTLTAGGTTLASTGPESIPAGSGGLVYFKLTPAGRVALTHAAGNRLPVTVRLHDASGASARTTLNLVSFATQGQAPVRSLSDSPSVRLVGATDFAFRDAVGGILAGCFASAPCQVSITITARGFTLAQTGLESLGAHQLGYLIFRLGARGRSLLAKAKGNQLGVTVTVAAAGTGVQAVGHVVLVSYH